MLVEADDAGDIAVGSVLMVKALVDTKMRTDMPLLNIMGA